MSVIHSYRRTGDENLVYYQTLMHMGVRLATWNQILDPWVYILLRRTVLRKIYLIVKCQAGLKDTMIGRWEKSLFPSMDQKEDHQVWEEDKGLYWCLFLLCCFQVTEHINH